MHEARLDVGANQHPEPDEVDTELVGRRRQHWDDDEGDLEEVEEERDHEDESVDEDQESDLAARQRRQHGLDPHLAADAMAPLPPLPPTPWNPRLNTRAPIRM